MRLFLLVLTAVCLSGSLSAQYTLQILHASDLEGGVEAIDRAPNFAAIADNLEDTYTNTVVLSAGDNYIPGPFFSAANDFSLRATLQEVYDVYYGGITDNNLRQDNGRVDITIMNVIGFDASALGNHEFDAGTDAVDVIIGEQFNSSGTEVRWIGSQFPYLSANLDFSGDGNISGLFVDTIVENTFFQSNPNTIMPGDKRSIAPSTIITRGGEKIGVLGATTPLLESISSPEGTMVLDPGAGTSDMAALASILQPRIDDLIAAGSNKIVLVSHLQQITLEQALAPLLSGLDVIIAGGSDAILANGDDRLAPGDVASSPYPILTTNLDGDAVAIVSTGGEYSYVGRLIVEFDAMGKVDASAFAANLDNGPYVADSMMVENLYGTYADGFMLESKGELVRRLTDSVFAVVISKDSNTFGSTDVFLDGRRSQVRTQETNMGNLSADANLFVAQMYDPSVAVAIKNGGGIRAAIGEVVNINDSTSNFLPPLANPISGKMAGEVSQLDIENTLRFNNGLVVLTLTAEGLVQIIEHGISSYGPGETPGSFPQVAGVEFSFDPNRPANDRLFNLAITDNDGTVIDPILVEGKFTKNKNRKIRITTLDFLAGGGDGYDFPGLGTDRVDLEDVMPAGGAATFADAGSEQDALAEYLAANFAVTPYNEAEVDETLDTRIQILDFRSDAVYDAQPCLDALLNAPTGLTATTTGAGLTLSWNPIAGSTVCEVIARQVGSSSVARRIITGTEPSSVSVPSAALNPGSPYTWAARCGCAVSPASSGPLSNSGFFFAPSPRLMTITPNVINGTALMLDAPEVELAGATFQIIDMTGRVLHSEKLTSNQRTVNTSGWDFGAGAYWATITLNDVTTMTEMLFVQ